MTEEIKETVFLGISMILLAAVLWFASSGIRMRNEFAAARNTELQTKINTQEYREFNKYNGLNHNASCSSDVSGWEVIAVIREYFSNDSFEIYVDKDRTGAEFMMNSTLVRTNPGRYELAYLQTIFNSSDVYHPMLIYDGANVKNTTSPQNKTYASDVTGIRFIKVN